MLKKISSLVKTRSIFVHDLSRFETIAEPTEYFETLRKLVQSSSNEIVMSALYLGNSSLERELVQDLRNALEDCTRPNLKITIILDHSRAQRGVNNSVTMLQNLVNKHQGRMNVCLYQMPQLRQLSPIFEKIIPGQIKEVLGVYHCKYNIFDNNVILTGANLSNDYFTNRQDRYMVIQNNVCEPEPTTIESKTINTFSHHTDIASYLKQFTSIVTSHCHTIAPGGAVKTPVSTLTSLQNELTVLNKIYLGDNTTEVTERTQLLVDNKIVDSALSSATESKSMMFSTQNTMFFPLIQHTPIHIHEERNGLIALIRSVGLLSNLASSTNNVELKNDININGGGIAGGEIDSTMPTSGKFGAFNTDGRSEIKVATPYTSFKSALMAAMLTVKHEGTATVSIINPSIQAHGFATATGVKSYIPKLHTCAFEQAIEGSNIHGTEPTAAESDEKPFPDEVKGNMISLFLHWLFSGIMRNISSLFTAVAGYTPVKPLVVSSEDTSNIPSIYEFARGNWTFHSKGMWFYPAVADIGTTTDIGSATAAQGGRDSDGKDGERLPYLTYIGSSNFGQRSWTRDFELGFILASTNPKIQSMLHKEYGNIEKWCNVHQKSQETSDKSQVSSKINGVLKQKVDISEDHNDKIKGGDAIAATSTGDSGGGFQLSTSDRIWLPTVTRIVKTFL